MTIPPKRTRESVAKSAADFVRESPAYPRSAERAVPVPVALAEFGEDAVMRRALAFLLEREVPRLLKQKVTRGAPPPGGADEEVAAALGRLVPGGGRSCCRCASTRPRPPPRRRRRRRGRRAPRARPRDRRVRDRADRGAARQPARAATGSKSRRRRARARRRAARRDRARRGRGRGSAPKARGLRRRSGFDLMAGQRVPGPLRQLNAPALTELARGALMSRTTRRPTGRVDAKQQDYFGLFQAAGSRRKENTKQVKR